MEEQLAIQNLLRSHLLAAQSKNPKFSLRSYSRMMGIHAGALSSIMNGKRNVSRSLAEKITRKLLIDPQRRADILNLFPEKRKYRKAKEAVQEEAPQYLQIEASSFKLMSEWEHFAVLSLVKTFDFVYDFDWVGQRLGISKFRAQEVIERLLALGFLKETENGGLERAHAKLSSSDDTVNLSVRKSHEENLELARESLHRESIYERDFTSITMAIDPAKMATAKEMIRKFQDELSDFMSSGDKKEVYRLSMQLFPLTKLSQNEITKELIQ